MNEKYVKFEGYHGPVGLIMKGYVTLLGADQDEMITMSSKLYDYEFPDMKKTSGINKGVSISTPETYILDRESFPITNSRYRANEALVDNWEVQAIISYRPGLLEEIKEELEENGIDIPVLDPSVDDLSSFTNR